MNALNGTRHNLALLVVACGLATTAMAQNARPGNGADRPLRGPDARQTPPNQEIGGENARPLREGREGRDGRGGPEGHRGRMQGHRGGPPAEVIAKFDLDGDGQLNEAERTAAREQMQAKMQATKAEFIAKFDADGDGQLNETERETARAELGDSFKAWRDHARAGDHRGHGDHLGHRDHRGGKHGQHGHRGSEMGRGLSPELIAEYDADGDGTLNEAERGVAREQFKAKAQAKRAEIVARFDADGDGELSQTERKAAAEAMRSEHRQRRAIQGVDANRDGKIDPSELAEAAKLIGAGDRRADFNADGSVNELDLMAITNKAAGN